MQTRGICSVIKPAEVPTAAIAKQQVLHLQLEAYILPCKETKLKDEIDGFDLICWYASTDWCMKVVRITQEIEHLTNGLTFDFSLNGSYVVTVFPQRTRNKTLAILVAWWCKIAKLKLQ